MKIKFESKSALKFIAKQPPKQRQRIMEAIDRIPAGDIKPLRGDDPFHRLRIGDYRIVFVIEEDTAIICNAGNRGDVYKG